MKNTSIENARNFISKVAGDDGLREKVMASVSDNETFLRNAAKIAKDIGLDCTEADLFRAKQESARATNEISDEALESVAGGAGGYQGRPDWENFRW